MFLTGILDKNPFSFWLKSTKGKKEKKKKALLGITCSSGTPFSHFRSRIMTCLSNLVNHHMRSPRHLVEQQRKKKVSAAAAFCVQQFHITRKRARMA